MYTVTENVEIKWIPSPYAVSTFKCIFSEDYNQLIRYIYICNLTTLWWIGRGRGRENGLRQGDDQCRRPPDIVLLPNGMAKISTEWLILGQKRRVSSWSGRLAGWLACSCCIGSGLQPAEGQSSRALRTRITSSLLTALNIGIEFSLNPVLYFYRVLTGCPSRQCGSLET